MADLFHNADIAGAPAALRRANGTVLTAKVTVTTTKTTTTV